MPPDQTIRQHLLLKDGERSCADCHAPVLGYGIRHRPDCAWIAALAESAPPAPEGWTLVRTSEYEELLEIKAEARGTFPRCLVVKAAWGRDLYVGWSEIVEAPVWTGTRAEALAEGCAESRLRRADETGTSSHPGFYRWDSGPMIAEQRGLLARDRLGDYATAYTEGRMEDCWDMLEPFDDETEVRRG